MVVFLSIDSVIFILYLVGLVVIGLLTARLITTTEEYYVAGRRLRLWLAFSTIAATWIGGGITIGVAGKAYAGKGIGLWGTTIGFGTTLILIGLFYAGPLHRLRLYTLADYFTVRFGKAWVGGLSAIIMLVAYVFAVTAQIVAGSKLLHVVFGWSDTAAVLVSGGIVVLYTLLGGLWAVSLTDFVQLSITFVGVLLALGYALAKAGVSTVIATAGGELGLLDPRILLAIDFWALVLVLSLGDIPAPDLMQRIFASRDESTAKKSSLLAGLSYYTVGVLSMLVGAAAYILFPGLDDPELAYPMLIKGVLPAGVAGIVLAGLMAAVMSNADSMLLAPATVAAKNIIKDIVKPDMSDRSLLVVSRATVLAIGLAAIAAALARAEVLYWLILAFDVLFAALFVPLTLGLWWKRYNRAGAAASIILGALSRIILEYLLNKGVIGQWWIASLGAPLISLIAGVIATLSTHPPTERELEAYYKARGLIQA
jgi:SSS family solute:Na+ symporter